MNQDKEPFLQAAKRTPVDIEAWAISLMEKHNRKSHLAPQLSPSTQALLRGEDTPASSLTDTTNTRTPTSGDIPIGSGDSLNTDVNNLMRSNGITSSPQPPQPPVLPQMANLSLHPVHPPRTSSANAIPGIGRLVSTGSVPGAVQTPTSAPLRPAPPPGPLPAPPGSLQSTLRQQQQLPVYQTTTNVAEQQFAEARRAPHGEKSLGFGEGYQNGSAPPY